MPSFGSFIIGSPEETVGDIVETIGFIQNSGLTFAEVFSLVPFPGTDVYQYAREHHLLKPAIKWSDFRIEGSNSRSVLRSHHFTAEQVDQIRSYLELNVLFNLNNGLPPKKLNHYQEINKILQGDLSRTEFSPQGQRTLARQKVIHRLLQAVKNPDLAWRYLIKKVIPSSS